MQTLYIDRRDTRLDVDRERILVHSPSLPRPLSIAFTYLSSSLTHEVSKVIKAPPLNPRDFKNSKRVITVLVYLYNGYISITQYLMIRWGKIKFF